MKHLYCGISSAERREKSGDNSVKIINHLMWARDDQDAIGEATNHTMKRYPSREGWRYGPVDVTRISDDLIREAYAGLGPAKP